ncbi:hypothetical protein [Bradyrhizobium sp. BTAi1]|jgi:hypothetical protein|uniref:hypothetical protein n=1 Tax=Bradyrhizobium sp. (strain BTAi1 / ATCC BAA-1182) TaxID=288000 RepID=UPI00005DC790|nr:hypothetical protein [Bradyrhizobium sp. BTAi1]ABQ33249.1 putative membrane protein of unknown function [Bradyrhizobium sp. BTAi1]
MPNSFAYVALLAWPVVAIVLYATRPLVQATLWTMLGAQLLLPVGTFFKIPMIPQFDKFSIPSLCALAGCMLATNRAVRLWRSFGLVEGLMLVFLFSPVVTSLLNSDPIYVGRSVIPGVGLYDGLSAALAQFIALIPFLIGREFLRRMEDVQAVFVALVVAGLGYSLLLLFEIRMSPQLHFWFYGYYPSDFIQQIREGGSFRPMVFMGHGLIAGFFAMSVTVAAAVLWRAKVVVVRSAPAGAVTFYLGVVLVLCKSGAALVYGAVLVPLVRWTQPRLQAKLAVILVALALTYPAMRIAGVFPTNMLFDVASSINQDRAYSLKFRFDQEEQLLQHAGERLVFGWGRFGRNRIHLETWEGLAGDASVTDGRWIITLGQFGLIGFIAEFGLFSAPVFFALRALRKAASFRDAVLLAGLSLLTAVNVVELLPNSTLSPWSWLLVGTLLGASEAYAAKVRQRQPQAAPAAELPAMAELTGPVAFPDLPDRSRDRGTHIPVRPRNRPVG